MTVQRLFPFGSIVGYQRYVYDLVSAMRDRDWVADPSLAITSDAAIYSKILRDPVAALAIRYRRHLVAGKDWAVKPGGEEEIDRRAAAITEALLKKIRRFADSRALLADAIFRGSAYSYVEGQRETFEAEPGTGEQNWWTPTRLVDVDRRRFRLVTFDAETNEKVLRWEFWSVERASWEPLDHEEWFVKSVVEEAEDSLGYGRGILDTLYFYQAAKTRVLQDCLAASERFGQGLLHIGIQSYRDASTLKPNGAGDSGASVASDWQTELEKHKARHILVHDKEDEIGVLEAGRGWELLMKLSLIHI